MSCSGPGGVIEGAHEGLVLIDMSTISPSVTRSVSASLAAKGVSALDAPVSGGDVGARDGTLTIMVGGPESVFESCLPILERMGKKVVYMGPTGAGQLTKLANQILVACNMIGVSECLNFAKKAGPRPQQGDRLPLSGCRFLLEPGEPRAEDRQEGLRAGLQGEAPPEGPALRALDGERP